MIAAIMFKTAYATATVFLQRRMSNLLMSLACAQGPPGVDAVPQGAAISCRTPVATSVIRDPGQCNGDPK